MPRIKIYTTRWCGFCVRAKTLLQSRGLPYEEVSLDDDPAFRQTVFEATGGWRVAPRGRSRPGGPGPGGRGEAALRPPHPGGAGTSRGPQRFEPGPPQRLVGVDVPHTCEGALVEQSGFQRRAAARETLPEA